MREIAREADVSTGTLYHYFPTKQAIFEQMFQYIAPENVAQTLGQYTQSMKLEEKLNQFTHFWGTYKTYYQNILLLLIDFYRNSDTGTAQQVIDRIAMFYINEIAKYLELPIEIAELMFTFLTGIVYHIMVRPETVSFEKLVGLFNAIVLEYQQQH